MDQDLYFQVHSFYINKLSADEKILYDKIEPDAVCWYRNFVTNLHGIFPGNLMALYLLEDSYCDSIMDLVTFAIMQHVFEAYYQNPNVLNTAQIDVPPILNLPENRINFSTLFLMFNSFLDPVDDATYSSFASLKLNIEAPNENGQTPLFYALTNNFKECEILKFITRLKPSLDGVDNITRKTVEELCYENYPNSELYYFIP